MIRAAVRRPVAVTMAYASVAVLGAMSWSRLPVELLPDAELPRLAVTAAWPGASSETVEAFLTAPLEAVLQQLPAVERIESLSQEGSARVALEFEREADMRFVRLDLSERLMVAQRALPAGVSGPRVEQYVPPELEPQARSCMRYTIAGRLTPEALRQLVDSAIAPGLREVDGVADVAAGGGRAPAIDVEVDDVAAAAFGIDAAAVQAAIGALELRLGGGAVESAGLRLPVVLQEQVGSTRRILDAPAVPDGGRLVRVRDVASVREGYEEAVSEYRVDGRPAVTLEVSRTPRSNAVEVADAVRAHMADVATSLPAGVELILDADQSEAIRTQMGALRRRMLVGAAVIFLVLVLSLGSLRPALIVVATIAFSILLTVNLAYFAGLTLNLLTLMGLAMGLGLIDDNGIVVLESVHRRWRRGEPSDLAAERGARDVLAPVVASTATAVLVLVPFVWLQGEMRVWYVPLGIVVGCALLASLLVSFTFVPALAARLLRRSDGAGLLPAPSGDVGARRLAAWHRIPRAATAHPGRFAVGGVALVACSFWLFERHAPGGMRWSDWWTGHSWISIRIELPAGADLALTDAFARRFEERLARAPGVRRYVTSVAARDASIRVTVADSLPSTTSPRALRDELAALGHGLGGARVRVYGFGPSFYGEASPPAYTIAVLGYDYAKVRDIAEDLGARLDRLPRVRDVDTNASDRSLDDRGTTEVVLRLERSALDAHGLTARDVVAQVARQSGAVDGMVVRVGAEQRMLEVAVSSGRNADLHTLRQSLVRTAGGGHVRLGALGSFQEHDVMSRIVREDQQYRRLVAYEFRGPAKLGDRYRDALVASTALPPGFALETRDGRTLDDGERRQIALVVVAALAVVFMVSAALFESLRQPFIVLLTVPMAMTGVFLTFGLTGASFTREAYIGSIMMAGIVVNHAILLVDRHNRLLRSGLTVTQAAAQATLDRARPILMTSATTVLGTLPLVVRSGPGSNLWDALGYALIGGLVGSTALVLTVTPALLVLLSARTTNHG